MTNEKLCIPILRYGALVGVATLAFLVLLSCDQITAPLDEPTDVILDRHVASAPHLASAVAEEVVDFSPADGEFPEGIAVNQRGEIFVSFPLLGEIWKLAPEGTFVDVVASFDLEEDDLGPLGLKLSPRSDLYAAVVSGNEEINGVWRIGRDGQLERLAGTEAILFANGLTFDGAGNLYVTDSVGGAVWKVWRDGTVEQWLQHTLLEGTGELIGFPIGANGIDFLPGQKVLRGFDGPQKGTIVVSSLEKGFVVGIPMHPDGSAGEPELLVEDEGLIGLDGLVLDETGTLYGAVNIQDRIVQIDLRQGTIVTIADEDLDFPASLAFGAARDRHSLFVTNFALFTAENPGIVKMDLGPPGRRNR